MAGHPDAASSPERDEILSTGPAVIAACTAAVGEGHPVTLGAELNYAFALAAAERPAEALPHARRALAGCERLFEPDYPMTLNVRKTLSVVLHAVGRHADAVEQGELVVAGRTRVLGPAHPWTLNSVALLHQYRDAARSS